MIQSLISEQSAVLNRTYNKFILDYPMGSYIPVWKIFRAFSKENDLIANHVRNTNLWKKINKDVVMDIGGGDGLVLKKIIDRANQCGEIRFIEPNDKLLFEAIKNLDLGEKLTSINKDLFSLDFNRDFKSLDLALLIHVLYLLESRSLTILINSLSRNTGLIIVTDENDSLFSDCWSVTATKYARRSRSIHDEINELVQLQKVEVKKTSFKTYLKNPYRIERKDLRESLLSMITYSEYSELSADSRLVVKSIFDKYSKADLVECNSSCYEITKL